MCSQLSGDVWAARPSIGHRLFKAPEHDRGDDEVEAGGAKLLRLGIAVRNPALFEGADDLREETTLLALVEPGMAASAQFRLSSQ